METVVLPRESIAEIARWAPLRHRGSSCRCPISSLLVYTSAPEAPGDGRVLLAGGALPLPGGERMTTSVISIREDLALEEALRLMIDHDVHHPRGPGLERRGILLLYHADRPHVRPRPGGRRPCTVGSSPSFFRLRKN